MIKCSRLCTQSGCFVTLLTFQSTHTNILKFQQKMFPPSPKISSQNGFKYILYPICAHPIQSPPNIVLTCLFMLLSYIGVCAYQFNATLRWVRYRGQISRIEQMGIQCQANPVPKPVTLFQSWLH